VRQQINLYQQSAAARARQVMSASTVMVGGAAIVLSLAGIWGFGMWKVSHLGTGVELVRQQHEQQQRLLSTAPGGAVQTPEQIQAENLLLRAEVQARQRALDLLNAGAAGQPSGFSSRLEALARRHVQGLWLDRLVLGGDSAKMNLSGATLDADLVPRYLQSLANDPALTGTRFDEFVIEQPEANQERKPVTPGLRFRASNTALTATLPQVEDPS
jgi:hypothetical protein